MSKKKRAVSQLVAAFLLLGWLLLVTGCGNAPEEQQSQNAKETAQAEAIKIGVAGALSGDLASYGIPSMRAAQIVVDKINAAGGILNRPVALVIEDDVCKPEVATNIATRMVSQQVVAVIGHICSGATKAALGIYNNAGLVAISPSATNPELTQSGRYPNFFRTIAADDAQARLEVDFAIKTLGLKTFAVLHDKGDYGKGLAEYAKRFIAEAPDAKVVLYEGVTPGAVDYSAVVQKIKRSGAQAVIFGGYHPEASKIVTQMRRKNMALPFISDDGVKDETFIKVAKEYAEGVYATGPRDVTANALAITAREEHQQRFHEQYGAFFLNAYAATQALLNAIQQAGSTDYDAVVQALRSQWVETPLGRISFDERGDAKGVGFSMYQVKNGAYVEIP